LFLIEEIENDLHPRALKGLLEIIVAKSKSNQFIVSTHNNIVVRHLGSAPDAKVYSLEMNLHPETSLPICGCVPVGNSPEQRVSLLENLGYEIYDSWLWQGYLLLEESSAEKVIRDFLIPQFFPGLGEKLKTIAASGVDDVEPRFHDFLSLFVFIHTAQIYRQRAWVATDGDPAGQKVVTRLKEKFADWPDNHFRSFQAANFENYYPKRFSSEVSSALGIGHGPEKQAAKKKLLDQVMAWAQQNVPLAKEEFARSAKEVLDFLREIETKLG
jgi:hypothetical protein